MTLPTAIDRAKKFIRLIERYDNFDELTPTIINEFVEKILVHERDQKGSQTANQKVEIYFNFIGDYEAPKEELSEEEIQKLKEEEKERERKDRLHQNYLNRKANGKQKEYEDRYEEKRIKMRDKKKEKLLKNYYLAKDEILNIRKSV